MIKTKTTQTKTIVTTAIVSLAVLGMLSSFYYYSRRVPTESYQKQQEQAAQVQQGTETYKIRATMKGASTCNSLLKTGTSTQCGLKYVGPIGTQAGTKAHINTSQNTVTVIGYGEFTGQVCTKTAPMSNIGGILKGEATCSTEGRTYTAYGEKSGLTTSPPPSDSTYQIQAKIIGPDACETGLINGTVASCGPKHITAFDVSSVATINKDNNTVTVRGYDGSGPNYVCTNTVAMTGGSGTASCTAGGRTYVAYGRIGGSAPSGPSCTISFNPNTITKGQTTTSTWSSTGDADGRIQYVCKCADGQCESVNTQYGGRFPDIYEQAEQSASGTTTTFGPPETVVCTATVRNSAGVTNTCKSELVVKPVSAPTQPQPSPSPQAKEIPVISVTNAQASGLLTEQTLPAGGMAHFYAVLPFKAYHFAMGGVHQDWKTYGVVQMMSNLAQPTEANFANLTKDFNYEGNAPWFRRGWGDVNVVNKKIGSFANSPWLANFRGEKGDIFYMTVKNNNNEAGTFKIYWLATADTGVSDGYKYKCTSNNLIYNTQSACQAVCGGGATPPVNDNITDITDIVNQSKWLGSASSPLSLSKGQSALYKFTLNQDCAEIRVSEYFQEATPGLTMVVKKGIAPSFPADLTQINKIIAENKYFNGIYCSSHTPCGLSWQESCKDGTLNCLNNTHPDTNSWYAPERTGSLGDPHNQIRIANATAGTYYIGLYYADLGNTGFNPAKYILQVYRRDCSTPILSGGT